MQPAQQDPQRIVMKCQVGRDEMRRDASPFCWYLFTASWL